MAYRVKKTTLKNGLTVITERFPGTKTLSVGVWVKAGTRQERSNEAGIYHFLEHMVFKGTQKRTAAEITRQVERVGGEFNAFTTREYTCFHVTLMNRDLELGVDILGNIILDSAFDPEELERERKVILQELAMVAETPEEISQDLYFELIYGTHGLGKSILGSENSVRKMKRSDLLRYFRKHYRPDNLIVSVVGNVPHNRVMRAVGGLSKRNWPGRPKKRLTKREEGFAPAPKIREGLWWIPRKTEQAHVVWGVETPKYTSRDQAAIVAIAAYLGGGMSSHLFQEIREKKGMAYTVYSNLQTFFDSGVLTIYVGCPMKQSPVALRLIEDAVIKLCTQKLPEEELDDVKESLKGTLVLGSDSSEAQMQGNAVDEIYFGEIHSTEAMCEDIDAITPADVRRVAKKLFGAGRRSILVYGPRPSPAVRKKLKPHFPRKYLNPKKSGA